MTDTEKLREAITRVRDWSLNEDGACMERFFGAEEISRICKAAESALTRAENRETADRLGRLLKEVMGPSASLPNDVLIQTKMFEVWRVEWATPNNDGVWTPLISCYETEEDAERAAEFRRGHPSTWACVKVTGPHLQEVPA